MYYIVYYIVYYIMYYYILREVCFSKKQDVVHVAMKAARDAVA